MMAVNLTPRRHLHGAAVVAPDKDFRLRDFELIRNMDRHKIHQKHAKPLANFILNSKTHVTL